LPKLPAFSVAWSMRFSSTGNNHIAGRDAARSSRDNIGMTNVYRIYGAEMSPYSVKVRAYARFKGIPHKWLNRGGENAADYAKYAKIQIVPLVVTPEGEGIQDSTPIIERLEAQFPSPSIHPDRQSPAVPVRPARRTGGRVGQQMDVPLPLASAHRSAGLCRSAGAGDEPGHGRSHAAGFRPADKRAHDGPRMVCRVKRRDGAFHRKLIPHRARSTRRASRVPDLTSSVRAPRLLTSPCGDRSTTCGPTRRRAP
jgi:hypothetical protein